MKVILDNIIADALALSPEARAYVAEKLIESLDFDPTVTLPTSWQNELTKRCKEIEEEAVELVDVDAVFDRSYAAL